jgi:hypothetical protein
LAWGVRLRSTGTFQLRRIAPHHITTASVSRNSIQPSHETELPRIVPFILNRCANPLLCNSHTISPSTPQISAENKSSTKYDRKQEAATPSPWGIKCLPKGIDQRADLHCSCLCFAFRRSPFTYAYAYSHSIPPSHVHHRHALAHSRRQWP